MAKNKHVSETPATQFLKKHGVAFSEHPYDYVDHGGAPEAARQLALDPHAVEDTFRRDWASKARDALDLPVLHLSRGTSMLG